MPNPSIKALFARALCFNCDRKTALPCHWCCLTHHEANLDPRKFLTAFVENLNFHFFKKQRASAKRVFQNLADGKRSEFMLINLGELGEIECGLVLDHSEYVGDLGFGSFRQTLALMMEAIVDRLERGAELNILNNETGDVLFNIPGMTRTEDGKTNVLVCGLRQAGPGVATIQLMFLNPDKYAEALAATLDQPEQDNNSDNPAV